MSERFNRIPAASDTKREGVRDLVKRSGQSQKKDQKNASPEPGFTHDSEHSGAQEVPSISLLLKRKKLSLVNREAQKTEVSLILEAPQALRLDPHPQSKIQPAPKKKNASVKKLLRWDAQSFSKSPDPLARALSVLIQKGVTAGVFLAIQPPPPGEALPRFFSTSAFADLARLRVWRGLIWDPTLLPDLWREFAQTGLVELPPPGANTTLMSARNVVRSAFGVESEEWITLLRVGPSEACRGVLALISSHTLAETLGLVLPLVQASVRKRKPPIAA